MKEKIFIADDDCMLRRVLSDFMKKQEYQVILAEDGQKALDLFFAEKDISLCILDVMMPHYTGYEVLETIREHSDVPVIMLTALGEEDQEIKGFHQGANDYIAKPFSFPILLARMEALLSKERKNKLEDMVVGQLTMNLSSHCAYIEDVEIQLNNKEFSLLLFFLQNQNQVLSREQLLNKVWGYDYQGEIRTVDTHVKMLRKKLLSCQEYVVTVRGLGYKFQVNQ